MKFVCAILAKLTRGLSQSSSPVTHEDCVIFSSRKRFEEDKGGKFEHCSSRMHKIYSREVFMLLKLGGVASVRQPEACSTPTQGCQQRGKMANFRHVFAVKRSRAFHQANDAIFHISEARSLHGILADNFSLIFASCTSEANMKTSV